MQRDQEREWHEGQLMHEKVEVKRTKPNPGPHRNNFFQTARVNGSVEVLTLRPLQERSLNARDTVTKTPGLLVLIPGLQGEPQVHRVSASIPTLPPAWTHWGSSCGSGTQTHHQNPENDTTCSQYTHLTPRHNIIPAWEAGLFMTPPFTRGGPRSWRWPCGHPASHQQGGFKASFSPAPPSGPQAPGYNPPAQPWRSPALTGPRRLPELQELQTWAAEGPSVLWRPWLSTAGERQSLAHTSSTQPELWVPAWPHFPFMLSPPGRGPRHHHQAANSSSRSQILLSAPVLLQGPPVDHPVVERSGPRVGGLSHRRACPEHPGTPEKLREPDNPPDPETDWVRNQFTCINIRAVPQGRQLS